MHAEHFRHEHWLCEDADCLAKKFIVFASEQEFRQHSAREHAGAMSRAEKRHALTIPVNFQVRHAKAVVLACHNAPVRGAAVPHASAERCRHWLHACLAAYAVACSLQTHSSGPNHS